MTHCLAYSNVSNVHYIIIVFSFLNLVIFHISSVSCYSWSIFPIPIPTSHKADKNLKLSASRFSISLQCP